MENATETKIKEFTDLDVWKFSHYLVLDVYKDTKKFPDEERFGLSNQMRRASVSITSNIAEGFGRKSPKDKAHFYQMSLGSLYELQSQIHIAKDLCYISEERFASYAGGIIIVSKLINGILKSTLKTVIHNI